MGLADRIKLVMGTMSNGEFARACGVAPAAVTFWLSGATKSLKAETAAKMEKATGYRANWIVTGLGPRRIEDKAPPDEVWPFKLVSREKILALDPDQRAFIDRRLQIELQHIAAPLVKPQTILISRTKASRQTDVKKKAG